MGDLPGHSRRRSRCATRARSKDPELDRVAGSEGSSGRKARDRAEQEVRAVIDTYNTAVERIKALRRDV